MCADVTLWGPGINTALSRHLTAICIPGRPTNVRIRTHPKLVIEDLNRFTIRGMSGRRHPHDSRDRKSRPIVLIHNRCPITPFRSQV